MRSPHRLADPMVVILGAAATGPLDLRRITVIGRTPPTPPPFPAPPLARYAAVADDRPGNANGASTEHGRAA